MKLLIDENIGLKVVDFLRQCGHDTVSVIEKNPGATDTEVLALAFKEGRVLITSDTDFGELIYLQKQPHAGFVLLRLHDETNTNKIRVLKDLFIAYKNELQGNVVVVTETKVRIRSIRVEH